MQWVVGVQVGAINQNNQVLKQVSAFIGTKQALRL